MADPAPLPIMSITGDRFKIASMGGFNHFPHEYRFLNDFFIDNKAYKTITDKMTEGFRIQLCKDQAGPMFQSALSSLNYMIANLITPGNFLNDFPFEFKTVDLPAAVQVMCENSPDILYANGHTIYKYDKTAHTASSIGTITATETIKYLYLDGNNLGILCNNNNFYYGDITTGTFTLKGSCGGSTTSMAMKGSSVIVGTNNGYQYSVDSGIHWSSKIPQFTFMLQVLLPVPGSTPTPVIVKNIVSVACDATTFYIVGDTGLFTASVANPASYSTTPLLPTVLTGLVLPGPIGASTFSFVGNPTSPLTPILIVGGAWCNISPSGIGGSYSIVSGKPCAGSLPNGFSGSSINIVFAGKALTLKTIPDAISLLRVFSKDLTALTTNKIYYPNPDKTINIIKVMITNWKDKSEKVDPKVIKKDLFTLLDDFNNQGSDSFKAIHLDNGVEAMYVYFESDFQGGVLYICGSPDAPDGASEMAKQVGLDNK